ncbi:MAG: DNA repair protein RecO [Spirochaetes bacterium]|nr:DNA repair protein RecO [Spirochaetota bacterium]
MVFKDKGIVLRSTELTGADRLITLFLYEKGKTKIIFKGVEKPKSRKVSSSQIGSYLDLSYRTAQTGQSYVSEVKIINSFSAIREDPVKFLYLNYILELFSHLVLESEKNTRMFHFLVNALIFVKNEKVDMESVMRYIEYRMIQLSGILPDFHICHQCQRSLGDVALLGRDNHLFCPGCASSLDQKTMFDRRDQMVLKGMDRFSFKAKAIKKIPHGVNKKLKNLFYNLIVSYISSELKSYKIVYDLLKKI